VSGDERLVAITRDPVEEAATNRGLPWTVQRCADLATNTLAWAPQIRAGDKVRLIGEAIGRERSSRPEQASMVASGPPNRPAACIHAVTGASSRRAAPSAFTSCTWPAW
jgi:hypothetical protein